MNYSVEKMMGKMRKNEEPIQDWRGIPTAACPVCGCDWLRVAVHFDSATYEIAGWGINDAECWACGTLVTAPCPPDLPKEWLRDDL